MLLFLSSEDDEEVFDGVGGNVGVDTVVVVLAKAAAAAAFILA